MLGFCLHLVCDAHPLQQLGKINAAGAARRRIRVGDCLCGEKCLFELVRCGNIWLNRALFYDDGYPRTGEGCVGIHRRFSVPCQCVEALTGQDEQISRLTLLDTLDQHCRCTPTNCEFVTAYLLKLGSELLQGRLHTDCTVDLDLRCGRKCGVHKQKCPNDG